MRILVFSLFLCFTSFTSQAQSNSKTADVILLVNGATCDKCSLELTREQLKKINLSTNIESVKIAGFKLKVSGSATIAVKGHKLNYKALSALDKASIGGGIAIFGINSNKGEIKTYIKVKIVK